MYQYNPPLSPKETMPTMYDLPSELVEESGLPEEFHCIQADLLSETCQTINRAENERQRADKLAEYWRSLVQNGINKPTILNPPKAYTVLILTFDF
ncbi:hypothetical protein [Aphanizomenon flos-aquae]|uniref:hypothetical protein n=1 Tax=Aphanizomenon flos-aquae TaxID=1176 RepID=UPI00047FF91B|nr:hypothetical protein [Aphanizomenon flos-aquae]